MAKQTTGINYRYIQQPIYDYKLTKRKNVDEPKIIIISAIMGIILNFMLLMSDLTQSLINMLYNAFGNITISLSIYFGIIGLISIFGLQLFSKSKLTIKGYIISTILIIIFLNYYMLNVTW